VALFLNGSFCRSFEQLQCAGKQMEWNWLLPRSGGYGSPSERLLPETPNGVFIAQGADSALCTNAVFIFPDVELLRQEFQLDVYSSSQISSGERIMSSIRYFRLPVESLVPQTRYHFKTTHLGVDPVEDEVVRIVQNESIPSTYSPMGLLDKIMPWTFVSGFQGMLRTATGRELIPSYCGESLAYLVEVTVVPKRTTPADSLMKHTLVPINIGFLSVTSSTFIRLIILVIVSILFSTALWIFITKYDAFGRLFNLVGDDHSSGNHLDTQSPKKSKWVPIKDELLWLLMSIGRDSTSNRTFFLQQLLICFSYA